MTARDIRYGRRGGRWANADKIGAALAQIQETRLQGLRDGTWPTATIPAWRAKAEDPDAPGHQMALDVMDAFRGFTARRSNN